MHSVEPAGALTGSGKRAAMVPAQTRVRWIGHGYTGVGAVGVVEPAVLTVRSGQRGDAVSGSGGSVQAWPYVGDDVFGGVPQPSTMMDRGCWLSLSVSIVTCSTWWGGQGEVSVVVARLMVVHSSVTCPGGAPACAHSLLPTGRRLLPPFYPETRVNVHHQ